MEIRESIRNASDEELLNELEEVKAIINDTDVSQTCAGEYGDMVRLETEIEKELKWRA